MPFGVLIQPGRQTGHTIGPSGDRHRHPVVLIIRWYCVHLISFLEPGAGCFICRDVEAGIKAERIAKRTEAQPVLRFVTAKLFDILYDCGFISMF